MNAERLTEIRERWAKSNFEDPAPWRVVDKGDGYADVRDAEGYRVTPDFSHVDDPTVTAVAAAPTDIADLLAEVERLRAVVDAARRLRGGDFWGAEWWVLGFGDYGFGCAYCEHGTAARCQDVKHADDCPAIALDRALDALGGDS